ncbi:MAG: hypothetical protein ACYCOU_00155 [Sulfobacillus sp.]
MAAQTQKVNHAAGGITPLGTFTITPGTPQSILKNTALSTVRYALQCRQIGISVDSTPAGQVFLNYGDYNGGGTGVPDPLATVLIVQSGQQASLPIGARTTDGMIDATQFYLDGSAACVVTAYLMDATS